MKIIIPEQGQPAKWVRMPNAEFVITHCNLGGKCDIKETTLPNKRKVIKSVDVSELILTTTNGD